ncbi:MAG: hypothetical protein IJ809_00820 [Clostridia bacterium]|nr:hypothetical protein [Clostridia bacterium]
MKIKKYLDISEIYDVSEILEDAAIVNISGIKKYVYFFRINPVLIIDKNDKRIYEIISKYEQFLRLMNLDFQIIMKNKEINVEDYFEISKEGKDEVKKEMIDEYMKNLKNLFNYSKIYAIEYLLVISTTTYVKNVENYLKILDEINMKCEKIVGIENISNYLMKGVEFI